MSVSYRMVDDAWSIYAETSGKFEMPKDSVPWKYNPASGWIHGQARVAAEAGYRSPHYLMKKIQGDPTAAFIIAVGDDFDTSVNSVPPGKDFVPVSIPASLHAWDQARRAARAENRNTDGLIRWESMPTDVSGGIVR